MFLSVPGTLFDLDSRMVIFVVDSEIGMSIVALSSAGSGSRGCPFTSVDAPAPSVSVLTPVPLVVVGPLPVVTFPAVPSGVVEVAAVVVVGAAESPEAAAAAERVCGGDIVEAGIAVVVGKLLNVVVVVVMVGTGARSLTSAPRAFF